MGSRTKARECALQALYQLDLSGGDPRDAVRGVLAHFEDADEVTGRFADELVRGVQSERGQIDAIIQQSSTHWKLERMARVDRNILRLSVFEMTHLGTPAAVAIDEALELARKFSNEESVQFVNGVLDAVHRELAPSS